MSNNKYYNGSNHIFDNDYSDVVNILPASGKTLNIQGLTGGGGTVGGLNTQIQYNDNGNFAGIPSFTYVINELIMDDPLTITDTSDTSLNLFGGINLNGNLTLNELAKINFSKGTQPDFLIDVDAPTSGYKDLSTVIIARNTGPNVPGFNEWATNLRAYEFPYESLREVWTEFNIPHDIDPTTGIFFNVHITNNFVGPFLIGADDVRIYFEYTYAKSGENFNPTTSTISAKAKFSARYQHLIVETTEVLAGLLEPDAIVMVRCYRTTNTQDSFPSSAFVLMAGAHLKVNKFSTKYKDKTTTGSFYQ